MVEEYKISYMNLCTQEDEFQPIILIENGGEYGFAGCPRSKEYWCADEEQIRRMKQDFSKRNVKPVIISRGEERSLIEKIILYVKSKKDPLFLEEESESMSKLLEIISK